MCQVIGGKDDDQIVSPNQHWNAQHLIPGKLPLEIVLKEFQLNLVVLSEYKLCSEGLLKFDSLCYCRQT